MRCAKSQKALLESTENLTCKHTHKLTLQGDRDYWVELNLISTFHLFFIVLVHSSFLPSLFQDHFWNFDSLFSFFTFQDQTKYTPFALLFLSSIIVLFLFCFYHLHSPFSFFLSSSLWYFTSISLRWSVLTSPSARPLITSSNHMACFEVSLLLVFPCLKVWHWWLFDRVLTLHGDLV